MPSHARHFLARLSHTHGVDGVLVLRRAEEGVGVGTDLAPGSMAFPPCRCGSDKCPDKPAGQPPRIRDGGLGAKVAEVNRRSRKDS